MANTTTKKKSASNTFTSTLKTMQTVQPKYEQRTYKSQTYNKGMPDAYKAQAVTADTYNGPTYQAQQYQNGYQAGTYDSKYMPQIEQRLNDVANWKYDPLQDASYQALASVYGARGNLAAKNSLADAAMLNGGYGTSNAVSAAQQARNQYNQELAAMIPELEQAAYNRAQTGLSALMDVEGMEYGRFRDTEEDKKWAEQNAQNIFSMNNDERYRAVQNALDVFNTDTANKQWAEQFNQGERQFGYNSLWDRYNAKNANRQWVSGMNQNERQFAYNAAADNVQQAAANAWDYLSYLEQQKKAAGSGGGGGGRKSGGGGGGYVGGSAITGTGTEDPYTKAEKEAKKSSNKKNAKGKVAGREGQSIYVNYHKRSTK